MIWYEICLVDETNNLLWLQLLHVKKRTGLWWFLTHAPWQSHIACMAVQPMSPTSNEARLPRSPGGTAGPLAGHWAHPAQDWATTCGYRCARGSLCTLGNGLSVPLTTQSPLKSMPFKHPNSFRYLAIDPDSVLGQATRQFWGLWSCK